MFFDEYEQDAIVESRKYQKIRFETVEQTGSQRFIGICQGLAKNALTKSVTIGELIGSNEA